MILTRPGPLQNLILLIFLVILRPFTLFVDLKLKKLSGRKVLKIALLGNYLSDLFTEVEIWY